MYLGLAKQLTEQIKSLNEQNIADMPTFKVMVHLRDKLIEFGFDNNLANRIVAAMDIQIPNIFNDETMEAVYELADEMATLTKNMRDAVVVEFGSSDDILLSMMKDASIKFT